MKCHIADENITGEKNDENSNNPEGAEAFLVVQQDCLMIGHLNSNSLKNFLSENKSFERIKGNAELNTDTVRKLSLFCNSQLD
jgi:hypothetical protein